MYALPWSQMMEEALLNKAVVKHKSQPCQSTDLTPNLGCEGIELAGLPWGLPAPSTEAEGTAEHRGPRQGPLASCENRVKTHTSWLSLICQARLEG